MKNIMKNLSKEAVLERGVTIEYAPLLQVVLGVLAIFASAQISIPIKPIPITFQTVMISFIALTYSPRMSFITVLTYLGAGAIGLPMFINFGSGLSHFTTFTGGYLLGFAISSPVMGLLYKHVRKGFFGVFFTCLIGHIIIYTLGIAWLSTLIGLEKAIYSGFIIYIPTGIAKMAIFSSLFSYIKKA